MGGINFGDSHEGLRLMTETLTLEQTEQFFEEDAMTQATCDALTAAPNLCSFAPLRKTRQTNKDQE